MTTPGPGQPGNPEIVGRSVRKSFPRLLLAMLAAGLLILLSGGIIYHRSQEQQLRAKAEEDLAAVARLKAEQIMQWRAERLADAAVVTASPFTAAALTSWLAGPLPELRDAILAHFRILQQQYHYHDILLADVDGRVLLSLSGRPDLLLHQDALRFLAEALRRRQPLLSDLHSGPAGLASHLDVIAPFFAGDPGSGQPAGAVILQSDARQFLYPMIESWPGRSPSAETLLVRREGDRALFLNELRHQKDTSLKLGIPLSRTQVPAVMAVLGGEGVYQGLDYRGVEVVAAVRAVPDSSWHVVAKIDAAEVFQAWHAISLLIMLLILTVMAVSVAGVAIVWQRMAKVHYRELYRANAERLRNQEQLQAAMAAHRLANDLIRSRLTIMEYAADHNLDELLQKILDEVEALTGSAISFYHFVESDQKTLTLQAWSTRTSREYCRAAGKGLHYAIDQAGVWVDCVHQRRPVIHNDYASLPHRRGLPPGHAALVRELVAPIMRADRVVAILGVGNKAVDYVRQDVEIVSYLADVAWEITVRKMAEEEVHRLNAELEQRVAERTGELQEAHEKILRQERLAAVGQLAGGIGHELRKPLTVMANAVYYLRLIQPGAEGKVKEYLGILENEVFFAEKIISDLLDFSRMKAADRAAVTPAELVKSALERFPAPENIMVKLDVSADLPAVCVDRYQLIQVLGNLVVNGCQAMSEGGELTVAARQEGEMLALSVTDTGPGIAAKNMARLFEPFFTTKVRGTGLGLAVSRRLVEANNGRIGARNESGRGATFLVHLPLYREK
ncbi:MAG: GAF domain-containing protein [Desulfurivibrio sp.]|nr:MAG: GAF domain-containing protein [Desulfurivibrio sp.]